MLLRSYPSTPAILSQAACRLAGAELLITLCRQPVFQAFVDVLLVRLAYAQVLRP